MCDLKSAVLFRFEKFAFLMLFALHGSEDAILTPLQPRVKLLFDISKNGIGLPVLCILLAVHSQLLSFSKG